MLGALCGMCTPCEAPAPLGAPVPRCAHHPSPTADGSYPMVVTADGDLSYSILEEDLRATGYPMYPCEEVLRASGYPVYPCEEGQYTEYTQYIPEAAPRRKAQPVYVTPDGALLTPDGSVVTSDGTLVRSDGCLVKSDGTFIVPDDTSLLSFESDNNNYLSPDPSTYTISDTFSLEDSPGYILGDHYDQEFSDYIVNDPCNRDDNGVRRRLV